MEQGFLLRFFLLGFPGPQLAAFPSQADLFLKDFKKPRIRPGLLHEVAHAVLHRFHGQSHSGPSGHGHYRRSVLDLP